jgi:hydroxymethylpyrimidine/phosphomethylpyrimidine kinase
VKVSSMNTTPIVLTIAGSDSGGGAGIQADIKAISATGGYACSVITAITAQNTLGVSSVLPVSSKMVSEQLDAVFSDLNVAAVKIGMLADSAIIKVVAEKLRQYQPQHVVLDPVMVATSGDSLIKQGAVDALIEYLVPIASVITPNIPEALKLIHATQPKSASSDTVDCAESFNSEETAQQLIKMGAKAVLLKGGHAKASTSDDLLWMPEQQHSFSAKRIRTKNTHGTGCTLSSAMASYLAQGYALPNACDKAKQYITQALESADALQVGRGHGPVNHFFMLNQ